MLHSVSSGLLTVDVVEWFEGGDAAEACREDGFPQRPGAWCNEYYVRNSDPQPVAARVSGSRP